jgi:stage III sporulation protein SpoIIIAA
MSINDCQGAEFAQNSGVKVIASAHANNLENLLKKQELSSIIKKNTFEDIILLNNFKIVKIYGEEDWLKYF